MTSAIPQVLQEIQAGHGIGLAQAVRTLGHPTAPNTATAFRWCTTGVKAPDGRRVKLEHVRIGHRVVTTALAVERFVMALTDGESETLPVRTPAQRSRAASKAAAELEKMGV